MRPVIAGLGVALAVLVVILLMIGMTTDESEPQRAVIVAVTTRDGYGGGSTTTIETANGSRYLRSGAWGSVGDSLTVVVRTWSMVSTWYGINEIGEQW